MKRKIKNIIRFFLIPVYIIIDIFKGYGNIYINYFKNNRKDFKYNLIAITMFKNEAPYIIEWIEYHKIVGIEKFIIYDNHSSDNIKEVLKPYIDSEEVEYKLYPDKDFYSQEIRIQALNEATNKYRNSAKWIAVLDVDEFIVPVEHNNIIDFLNKYKKPWIASLRFYWFTYGYSGNYNKPKGLLIENYKKYFDLTRHNELPESCKEINFNHFKSIHNPRMVKHCDIHSAKNIFGLTFKPFGPSVIRINHYWTKSYEEFRDKLNKNSKYKPEKYDFILEYDPSFLSHLEDNTIDRFLPLLKEKIK